MRGGRASGMWTSAGLCSAMGGRRARVLRVSQRHDMTPWGWAVCTLCVCLLWTFRSQVQARVVFPMYPPNSPTASVHSYKVYNT